MKKKTFMSLFALGCSALLLAGCSTDGGKDKDKDDDGKKNSSVETLKCTAEMNEDGMISTVSVTFDYDNDEKEIVSGTMSMGMDYSSSLEGLSADEAEDAEAMMESMFGSMCDSFEGEGYKNCKSSFKKGKFDMSMEFDLKNIAETTDGDLNLDMTLEEIQEYFEEENSEENMKCVIE